jgi:hypothetical protein
MNTHQITLPAISLAHYCIARIQKSELKTSGSLAFRKSNRQEEAEQGTQEIKSGKNIYRLEDGTHCTLANAAKALQVSETYACTLFTKYKSRYPIIYKNHGPSAQNNKYKTADGQRATIEQLAKLYGYSETSISRTWAECNNDYIAANAKLKYKSEKRAMSAGVKS